MAKAKTYMKRVFSGKEIPSIGMDQGKGKHYAGKGVYQCFNLLYDGVMTTREGQKEVLVFEKPIISALAYTEGTAMHCGESLYAGVMAEDGRDSSPTQTVEVVEVYPSEVVSPIPPEYPPAYGVLLEYNETLTLSKGYMKVYELVLDQYQHYLRFYTENGTGDVTLYLGRNYVPTLGKYTTKTGGTGTAQEISRDIEDEDDYGNIWTVVYYLAVYANTDVTDVDVTLGVTTTL